ncbi:MAG: polymorphic toxin-type HINT domain-containing protein, partial [Bacteroidota bacterium]
MKQAIKCYIRAYGLLLCLLLFGAAAHAQTRSLQWGTTNGRSTVSIDELCPATEGYIEFAPADRMMIGLTDDDNPSSYSNLDHCVYPFHTSSSTYLYFYENGSYQGNHIVYATPQASDRLKLQRKGSIIKFYFNNNLVRTVELDPNQVYRFYSYNFGSVSVGAMSTIASTSLIEPCSNYNAGSTNALPTATTGESHNWVHNKVFDQHGDIVGETRVYLDRLGSAVQTQTKNYATNEVIGKQLVYDAQGRNALISLPAPSLDNYIEYQPKFLRSQSSNKAFDYTDFDTPSKANNPSKAKDIFGSVGRHYSRHGEAFVPTTEYPYSHVEFHQDGSIRRISQAGEHYRMGSGNETQYFYALSGGELAYLYGYRKSYEVDVPTNDPLNPIPQDIDQDILAYKTVTIGADDIEHISYVDASGLALATAVSGEPGGSNCSLQKAKHSLYYRSTQNTKIHLPAATKQSLRIGYGASYLVNTNPLNFITIGITDLREDTELVQGTDFQLTQGSGNYLAIQFLGAYASNSSFFRISFDYTAAYLDEYYDFYVPGYEPPVVVEYDLDYSDWTINYYDDRGLRCQSIQPKGIRCDFVDISQMGTFPFFKSQEIYTVSPPTYTTGPVTIKSENTPNLQTGLAQEVEMSVKTMLKPGIIVDHWYPSNDIINYQALAEPVYVDVLDNPFNTASNPNGDIQLEPISNSAFDALYSPVPVSAIDIGDESAIPPPVVPLAGDITDPDDVHYTCFNGVQDYGEKGIDCGGICPDCEDCEEDPEFFVSYEFEIHFQGVVNGSNQVINLGSGFIYRTLGLNCNGTLVDLTDPEEEAIQIDHFFSGQDISGMNLSKVEAVLHNTRVKTLPNAAWVNFNVTYQIHRFVRYIYLRLDGVREVFFNDPIPHTMKETVVYDDLYRIVAMDDPDRGLTEFMYDEENKLRFSQDARQATLGHFSYISYDARGRVSETGEYRGTNYYFPSTLRPPSPSGSATSIFSIRNQLDGLPSSNRADESYFTYDEIASNFPGSVNNSYESKFVEGRVSMSKNDDHTTWYKYDHKGQLVAAVQEYPEIGLKTMDYVYDCFGRLTKSIYQNGNPAERFEHLYSYDNNGDVRTIETKRNTSDFPKLHAAYDFYKLGQLKRTELGESLQGIDYTYTIDGVLKAINHPGLNGFDPGKDGYSGVHAGFAKDVFGMTLDYHSADYVRRGTFFNYGRDEGANESKDGRIKSIRWNTRNAIQAAGSQQHMFSYQYDWKQQLTGATYGFYTPNGTTNNTSGNGAFGSPAHGSFSPNGSSAYRVQNISYDANGNILSLHRKNDSGEDLDNMSYIYEHPDFLAQSSAYTTPTNKLRYVVDAAGFLDQGDVQNQQINNYRYNANGEIEKDQEKDISLVYNSFGKLDEIRNYAGNRLVMSFVYDEMGDRISKTTYDATGAAEKSTTYVREPGGMVVATYEKDYALSSPSLILNEYLLDGGQLGIFYPGGNQYVYHLTDHLGNVRSTISRDKDASGEAEILSFADYYPYGMVMPGHEQASSPRYRLGYQGQELDAKVGLYAFQLRMYDPRLGKWLSPDPYDQHWSPYLAMSNNPISFIDPDGGYDEPFEIQARIASYIRRGELDRLEDYLWRLNQFSGGSNKYINSLVMGWNEYQAAIADLEKRDENLSKNKKGERGYWKRGKMDDTGAPPIKVPKKDKKQSPDEADFDAQTGPAVDTYTFIPIDRNYLYDYLGIQAPPVQVQVSREQPVPKKSRWSKALDWVQTGLDVVGLVPGLGEVADGVNALIYLGRGDYTNAALSAAAMVPLAGTAATATKYLNKTGLLDDAASALYKRASKGKRGKPGCNCPGNGKCFTAGTLIFTQDGYVPIENIVVGDSVWAYNEISKARELKPVIDVFQREAEEIIRLSIGEQEIAVTAEHPFYSGGYWREAGQLAAGDTILLFDGTPEVISTVRVEQGSFKVYNFEVEDWHSYYVAETSVLVHNAGCGGKVNFDDLARSGKIDPKEVRFSQNSISSKFKDGGDLDGFIEGLKNGKISPDDIPAIRIVKKDGLIYTLDNRRLYSFQKAGIPIKYQKLDAIP